jgi:hypothetical protein
VKNTEKKKRGFPAYAKALVDARGHRPLSPTLLSRMWFTPVYVVEEWIKNEPGVLTWKRRNKKGELKTAYRVPLDVAERVRLKHIIGGKRGPIGDQSTAQALREAARV